VFLFQSNNDSLDVAIERLIEDWHRGVDVLFCIHPVDGSLVRWFVHHHLLSYIFLCKCQIYIYQELYVKLYIIFVCPTSFNALCFILRFHAYTQFSLTTANFSPALCLDRGGPYDSFREGGGTGVNQPLNPHTILVSITDKVWGPIHDAYIQQFLSKVSCKIKLKCILEKIH